MVTFYTMRDRLKQHTCMYNWSQSYYINVASASLQSSSDSFRQTTREIMIDRACVVVKEVFHHGNGNISKLWECLFMKNSPFSKFNHINKHLYLENNFNHLILRYPNPCNVLTKRAFGWANQACLWLLRTLTFRIIRFYKSIRQRLSFLLYNIHPTWLSLTNEIKFDDKLGIVRYLLLLIIKCPFICEWQSCRFRIGKLCVTRHLWGNPPVTVNTLVIGGFPYKGCIIRKALTYHDGIVIFCR